MNDRIKSALLCALIVVLLAGCGKSSVEFLDSEVEISTQEAKEDVTNTEKETAGDSAMQEEIVCVYICGAIKTPGVYEMKTGSRVCDIFQAAGGMLENAAVDFWNQARVLVDGEMIYVPTKEEVKEPNPEELFSEDAENHDERVNINTASKDELMTVPGIGEAKAESIISYREEHGDYKKVEDLMQIDGIKEGLFEKMKDYIKVN